MKHAIIIPDGAPDEPTEALDGRTPLQAAGLPTLDALAARGPLGTAPVLAGGSTPTEAAALLSILGYDPELHPAGEGILTAHARDLKTGREDQVFRCDLVTVIDGCLRDFTAGFIPPAEAAPLVDALNAAFGVEGFRVHACGGYRNVCAWENAGPLTKLRTTPPDHVLHQPIKPHMPRGEGARTLYDFMLRANALLREHDVNLVRQDLGENPANAIWLWGQGPLPELAAFHERHGVRGALVCGSDVMRGIGRLIGWNVVTVSGANGLPDTDYAAKGRAAVDLLESADLVCVHVRAPYILGVLGDAAGKVRALESIDRHIMAPLLERLQAEPEWRALVIAAQATSAVQHPESGGRTLFVFAGTGIESHRGEAFDEENAAAGELHPDRVSELMEYVLRR